MYRTVIVVFLVVGTLALVAVRAPTQQSPRAGGKSAPKLEAVAETRLLMEGLAQANFRGLERLLRQKPADAEAWTFARGQALLIAETANLLLLRPPRTQGTQVWFERATDLRAAAAQLARDLASKDFARSRSSLQVLANSCNRCHQSFRISVKIAPFAGPADEQAGDQP
jgi:cytochrome c556